MNIKKTENFSEILSAINTSKQKAYAQVNTTLVEGKTKGLMYMANPKVLMSLEHDLKPSLKTMEEPHLKALIKEDLKIHPRSKTSEIHTRIEGLDLKYLRRVIYKMAKNGELDKEGGNKNMVYFLANKK